MNVVAFSLWGEERRYLVGAVRNAELARIHYPGWICRFYVGTTVPERVCAELHSFAHADVRRMNAAGDWTALFWRFLPAAEADVEVMLSRDADSRLSRRESDAVQEWLRSGRGFHIIRDHPEHNGILAGLWGARRGTLPDMRRLIEGWNVEDRWSDQQFLNAAVYPRIANDCLVHDEFSVGVPFPTARADGEFAGASVDEHDVPDARQVAILREAIARRTFFAERNRLKRLAFRLRIWPPSPATIRRARRLLGR